MSTWRFFAAISAPALRPLFDDDAGDVGLGRRLGVIRRRAFRHIARDDDRALAWGPGDTDIVEGAVPAGARFVTSAPVLGQSSAKPVKTRRCGHEPGVELLLRRFGQPFAEQQA